MRWQSQYKAKLDGEEKVKMGRRELVFFFQAEDGIRDKLVTGVQTCALPISRAMVRPRRAKRGRWCVLAERSEGDGLPARTANPAGGREGVRCEATRRARLRRGPATSQGGRAESTKQMAPYRHPAAQAASMADLRSMSAIGLWSSVLTPDSRARLVESDGAEPVSMMICTPGSSVRSAVATSS